MDVLITVVVILSVFLGFRLLMQKRASHAKGKVIDSSIFDEKIKNLLAKEKSILYFYTPTCGACRSQAPIIDKIESDIEFVGKIDLSKNVEVAREFRIMGTPSTALMKGNTVADIFIGVKQAKFLLERFNQL